MINIVSIFPKKEVEEKLASGIPYVIRQNNPTKEPPLSMMIFMEISA